MKSFLRTEQRPLYCVFTHFNVLTLIGYSKDDVIEVLRKSVKHARRYEEFYLFQDYPLYINSDLEHSCFISNDAITLKHPSTILFVIIALVVSQSVGLERYEDLEAYFEQSKQLIDLTNSYSPFKRAKLIRFCSELTLVHYDMVSDLFLLDKMLIFYGKMKMQKNLYNELSMILELKDRFEVVEGTN